MVQNNYNLESQNQALRDRIADLERINEMHKHLNGILRSELVDPSIIDTTTFDGACVKEAINIATIVVKKQRDYGPANITAFGIEGVMIRLSDKINRLINLIHHKKDPENESVEDTFIDIAGYAVIGLMLQHDIFERPLKKEDALEEPSELGKND
jgi:hypothetical protein